MSERRQPPDADHRDYLCIDRYLRSTVAMQALREAFACGLIDRLTDGSDAPTVESVLPEHDPAGRRLLIDLLHSNGVLADLAPLALSEGFRHALRYRDLITAKLEFCHRITPDVLERFGAMLFAPETFQTHSRIFDLFGYEHCLEITPQNLARTRPWVEILSAYTRYEAQALAAEADLSGARRLLEIGGNSGEACYQLCQRFEGLHATVVDLPVVCELGRERLADSGALQRITFIGANALAASLPVRQDHVLFKSFLHDWPDAAVIHLLRRARESLGKDGAVLIFERATLPAAQLLEDASLVPMLVFFRHFRTPVQYRSLLQQAGFTRISQRTLALEVPFHLITARA